MNKTLVLGGNGFIGSAIVRRLVSDGVPTTVIDRSCPNDKSLGNILDKIEYLEKDYFNENIMKDALVGVKNIFHCITSTYPGEANSNPIYDIESNIVGAVKLLEVLKPHYKNIRLFFLSSGGTVYGNPEYLPINELHPLEPISSYGISKLTIEKYLHMHHLLHGLNYNIFRISNPYGETQNPRAGFGLIITLLYKVLKDDTIDVFGDGANVRDYIYIDDVVDAIVKVGAKPTSKYPIYNIGSGEGKDINQILDIIQKVTGKVPRIRHLESRSFDIKENYLDTQRLQNEFDWKPTVNLHKGIEKVWKSLLEKA